MKKTIFDLLESLDCKEYENTDANESRERISQEDFKWLFLYSVFDTQ